MQIKIEDATIRQNIEFFLEILRRAQQKTDVRNVDEAIYRACVHRKTGQLFFDEIASGDLLKGREWKPIVIHYEFNSQEGEMLFEIDEPEHPYAQFKSDDLSPLACRIMFQTLKTLNHLCHRLKGPSDPDAKISVLTRLKIDAGVPEGDRNLVISAWHQVDRTEAEELLWDKPIGTYLFRKDKYAKILESQLEQQLQRQIKCITISFNQPNKKFSDLTLVHHGNAWQIYNDDPSLALNDFSDLSQLLLSLGAQLKYPLFH